MTKENQLQLIIEEPYFSPVEILQTYDIQILKEEYSPRSKFPKVKFRAILQEADVINKNGRKYPKEVLQEVVNRFNNIIKIRKGIPGELNHPLVEGEIAKQRMSRIDLDNIAVIYKKFDFDGKYVIAEATTASTRKGLDLYGLIVDDGYNVGFSLRALGSVKPIYEDNGQKVLLVEKIYKPVTYDVVDNPSHAVARILNLNESEVQINNNTEILTESDNSIFIPKLPIGAYKVSEKIIEQSKYDPDLKELIDGILEDSIEVDIDGETVRICKDDKCILTTLQNLVDDIINLYFPPDNSNTNNLSNNNSLLQLYPAYSKPCKRLRLNNSQLFGPDKYQFIPYLVNKLINPNQQLFINTESINKTRNLIENIQYTVNNNIIDTINEEADEHIIFTDDDNVINDDREFIYEGIENINELEKILESIDENELNHLIDYYLATEKYEDINELLNIKTLDEEIEFYLNNLNLDKQKILNELNNELDDLITDDTI